MVLGMVYSCLTSECKVSILDMQFKSILLGCRLLVVNLG